MNWPLAQNEFTFLDRLKICGFFLNPKNRWSQDKYVKLYEQEMAKYTGSRYAVFVSSGSSANQLVAQFIKDSLIKNEKWPKRNQVIVNAVTWQTNVSVFIREGFEPVFIDVNLDDFCLDYTKLEEYLKKNHKKVACVFPTSVLGFTPNIEKLDLIRQEYPEIKFGIDCCENTFGQYYNQWYGGQWYNICGGNHNFTTTTSCFLAHQITSGTEGGFIFTNDIEEYKYYLMARAHGLIRNLQSYKEHFISNDWTCSYDYEKLYNPLVDYQFDFNVLSSNFRNNDISAFCGLLDFNKLEENKNHRKKIYNLFKENLDNLRYFLPQNRSNYEDIAFCLPIIIRGENKEQRLKSVKNLLDELKIERRGFISGNMLRQRNYEKYGYYKDYENAEYLNNFALYIGLNKKVTEEMVLALVNKLNKL